MKSKTLLWGMVLLLLIAGSMTYYFLPSEQSFSVVGGGTFLSVDQVSATGSGDDLEYNLLVAVNDGAEKGSVVLDQSLFEGLGSVPSQKYILEFERRGLSCSYDLIKDPNVIGEMYYEYATEQCLAKACPYDKLNLNDLVNYCNSGGGASQSPSVSGKGCEQMVSLESLGGVTGHWCGWVPEESNVPAVGECRGDVISREVTMPTIGGSHDQQSLVSSPDLCGFGRVILGEKQTQTFTVSEGETGGDWLVMQAGIVPSHELFRISSAEKINYQAVVRLKPVGGGDVRECIIDPVTKTCDFGNWGSVKFVGNLGTDTGCPDPGNDAMVVRDVTTNTWSAVDAGIGSPLAAYLNALNRIKNINVDYYTFTGLPENGESVTQYICDPAVGQPAFPEITAMNNLYGSVLSSSPVEFNYGCEVKEGRYVCDTGSAVVYPLLKVTLKASSIGVTKAEGKPKITGFSLDPAKAARGIQDTLSMNANTLTAVYVSVENEGIEDDSFDVSLSCPFPITQQSTRIAVAQNNAATAKILVSGEGIIQTCEIRAQSVNFAANRDIVSAGFSIAPSCDVLIASGTAIVATEHGCYSMDSPVGECAQGSLWVPGRGSCYNIRSVESAKDRNTLLATLASSSCAEQCHGNKDCVASCLSLGEIAPVCISDGEYMSMNDYLCNAATSSAVIPDVDSNAVWVGAPSCTHVCAYGYTGEDCTIPLEDQRLDVLGTFPEGQRVTGAKTCESCFDGIQNQDELGVDCGGTCSASCATQRAPDHCLNHLVDGDEGGRDCGGSCDYTCEEIYDGVPSQNTSLHNVVFWAFAALAVLLCSGVWKWRRK